MVSDTVKRVRHSGLHRVDDVKLSGKPIRILLGLNKNF